MNLGNIVVKEGYEVMAMIKEPFFGNDSYTAIIKMPSNKCTPYVVAVNYDITDGTWGHGIYCTTYSGAAGVFKDHL